MLKTAITQITTLIIFLSVFCSCGKKHKPYPVTLLQIDSLSENEAKKALPLLERLKDSLSTFDEEQQMYYDLLSLKVKDKMYIEHTSDSTIKRITFFYEQYGDRDKLLECYYYIGRVYRDLQDSPEALKYFQRALDIAGDTKQYLLLSKIYSQMGTLYYYQNVYEEAIPMHEKAYYYTALSGDSTTLPLCIRDMARIYNKIGKSESAIIFYEKAYQLALKVGDKKAISFIMAELSSVYRTNNKLKKAWKYMELSLQDTVMKTIFPTYASLARLYFKDKQLDSADYYIRKCLNSHDIYALSGAYYTLSEIEEACSNYKASVKYIRLHQQCQDSIEKITASEEIRKMRSLYNYQLREKENQRLQAENTKDKISFYQLLIAFLLFFILASYLMYRLKKRKDESETQTRKLRKEKEQQHKESLDQIDKNHHRLSQLEALLSEEREVKDVLQGELIQVQRDLISVSNRKIKLHHAEHGLLVANFKHSDIYLKFRNAHSDTSIKITDADWDSLQQELDTAYGNITTRLYDLYPQISLIELRICYLIKLSIKVTDMALLLNRTKSSISSARNRLYKKLTGKKGTPEGLDALITDL